MFISLQNVTSLYINKTHALYLKWIWIFTAVLQTYSKGKLELESNSSKILTYFDKTQTWVPEIWL